MVVLTKFVAEEDCNAQRKRKAYHLHRQRHVLHEGSNNKARPRERERATSRMSDLTKGLPSPHVQTSCSVPIKTPALFFLLMDFVKLFS